jgi:hypothetical protein
MIIGETMDKVERPNGRSYTKQRSDFGRTEKA